MIDTILTVTENREVSDAVYEMTLTDCAALPEMRAGQFLHVAVPNFTLRRPFCITKYTKDSATIIYHVIGKGTEALTHVTPGSKLKCILPIGNAFPIDDKDRTIVLIGGGLGVAPLLPILKETSAAHVKCLLGFATASAVILEQDFRAVCEDVTICTDDGSYGHFGRPTDLLQQMYDTLKPDAIYCCGPHPMLKAIQATDYPCKVYVSMEARMGCGVGACLVCTCPVKKGEVVNNVRVCVDGPVFSLKDVVL